MLDPVGVTPVGQDQADARIEEGELAVAMFEPLEIELDNLEGFGAWQEGDAGALLPLGCLADNLKRSFGIAVTEAHVMFFAIAPDGEVEPFAERIDHRHADAVQAA